METKSTLIKEAEKIKKIIESDVKTEPRKELTIRQIPIPIEDKIVSFLRSRDTNGFVVLNEFLKTLYPAPLLGAPPEWAKQIASKKLKNTLNAMHEKGEIFINNEQHKKLGTFFYEKDNPVTQYYNIGNLQIEAKIF